MRKLKKFIILLKKNQEIIDKTNPRLEIAMYTDDYLPNILNFVKRERTVEVYDRLKKKSASVDWGKTRRVTKQNMTTIDVAGALTTLITVLGINMYGSKNFTVSAGVTVKVFIDVLKGLSKKEEFTENELMYIKLFLLNSNFGKETLSVAKFKKYIEENSETVLFTNEINYLMDMNNLITKGIFEENRENRTFKFVEEIVLYG